MGIAFDVIVLAICASIIFRAVKHGFVKSVMGLVKGVVAFIAAYAFTPVVGDYIYKNFALDRISDAISTSIKSLSESAAGTFDLAGMYEEMPEMLRHIIERYSVDRDKLGEMCAGITEGSVETVDMVADYIASPVADSLSSAFAFAAIFIGALLVLSIVTFVIDAVLHLPVLNGMNKTLGIVFGIIEAVLIAFLVSTVTSTIITSLGSIDTKHFGEQIVEGSVIMRFFSSVDLFGLLGSAVR